MRLWLPNPPSYYRLDDLTGVCVDTFDGRGAVPQSVEDVEFYALPLTAGRESLALMSRMPSLRVAQALSAGVEEILPHVPAGVTLCNASSAHATSTAEMAVTLVLASLRGIPQFVGRPDYPVPSETIWDSLADKTVLLVGHGAIGSAVESRLLGFECEIRRVARHERPGVEPVEALPWLLPDADVVIVTVPLTPDTRGMVDAAFLAKMRDGALLVNVGRGPVVRRDHLLREVASGRLRAALDVTDPEPLPTDHPLRCDGALITPHVAGRTTALEPRLRRFVSEQVGRFIGRRPLLNVITGDY